MAKVRSNSARLSSGNARASSARKRSRSRWRCPVLLLVAAVCPTLLVTTAAGVSICTGSHLLNLQDASQGVLGVAVATLDRIPVHPKQFSRLFVGLFTEV